MNDPIERQAAIDEIQKYKVEHGYAYFDCANEIENDIKNLPPAQPEQRWIPCSERLPEEDHWLGGSGKQFSDNVLVSIYNSDDEDEWVDVSQTIDGEWRIELLRQWKIVAWMPLPKPYKEGNSDD